ncbi:arginine--tRNA ligase [bacterium]|nr:arginine--tRNA ligase [bacterium]
MIKEQLQHMIVDAVKTVDASASFTPHLEKPAIVAHGDLATNVALTLSKQLGKKPRELAERIQKNIKDDIGLIEEITIAGPGFLNFKIKSSFWVKSLQNITQLNDSFGTSKKYAGQKAVVEFVSANPTGPLHIGNARGGPLGDAICSLLTATGYDVTREFYVNDIGGQIDQLGRTMLYWMGEKTGKVKVEIDFAGGKGYQGEYVKELADRALADMGEGVMSLPEAEAVTKLGLKGIEYLQLEIKRDCQDMGIKFDSWIHEKDILGDGVTKKYLDELKAKNMVTEKDGATWFAPHDDYLADRECVLERSDGGRPTYFANDIAYHVEKYKRGYNLLLNIWGSNHHGHVPRVQAGVKALGCDPTKIETVLYQYVRVKRGNDAVKMSKRGGNFVLAREVLDEVGRDAFRFFLLSRSPEAHLDFDLELAKQKSAENPVYYVQYAHARISSILAKAAAEGHVFDGKFNAAYENLLNLPEEIQLAQKILSFPEMIEGAALGREPHKVIYYLIELAQAFQQYYDRARGDERYRVISADKTMTQAKLYFIACIRQVIKNGLAVLGISAPEKM